MSHSTLYKQLIVRINALLNLAETLPGANKQKITSLRTTIEVYSSVTPAKVFDMTSMWLAGFGERILSKDTALLHDPEVHSNEFMCKIGIGGIAQQINAEQTDQLFIRLGAIVEMLCAIYKTRRPESMSDAAMNLLRCVEQSMM
jgi:hypothetical protein